VGTPADSILSAASEITASHSNGLTWWVVALIVLGAALVLGAVLTAMTLADRKRHPHSHV
jgi:uncharacterized Rmd1/YagE family protein